MFTLTLTGLKLRRVVLPYSLFGTSSSVPAARLDQIIGQLKRQWFSDYSYGHMHGRAKKGGAEPSLLVEVLKQTGLGQM